MLNRADPRRKQRVVELADRDGVALPPTGQVHELELHDMRAALFREPLQV